MQDVLTISTQKPADAAFDYEELRKTGIKYIEQTASSFWTDYNIHDPGITTLELLCYALTDLSYRSAYSVADLLATEENTAENIQKHFFSAKQIFPNNAVTINDYRKLIIDIEGVKNAWLKKRTKQIFADVINKNLSYSQPLSRKWEPVIIKGFYDVLIEFDTDVPEEKKTEIKQEAKELLMTNRNICEDFVNADEVAKQEFRLCSEIEIKPSADPFNTLAKIFFSIQLHLTPLIKFYRLKELFDQNYTSDQIFEGPLLEHGFIKEEELIASDLKTEIHLSDIMHEILKEDAVVNISDIIFNPLGQSNALPDKWIINVADGKQPVVSILGSKVVLYKDGNPFRPDMNLVKIEFDKLMTAYITGNDSFLTEDISYDTGSYQNAESYYSIQNHYPKNYGISHWGLRNDATNERKAQAKQLQAYLYFFDQQLANYLSQLSHLRNLFSLDEEQSTYFTQLVDSFKDAGDLYAEYDPVTKSLLKSKEKIQTAAEAPGSDQFYQRRNLFLDHLLSRFAESFFDYVSILDTFSQFSEKDSVIEKKDSTNARINFLKNYPEYSSRRFNAYDYTNTGKLWDTDNTSGLEKRLERLLGFTNINRRSLVNIYTVVQHATNAANAEEFWFKIIDNRSGNILMIAAERFTSAESTEHRLEDVYVNNTISNYTSRADTPDGKFIFELKDISDKIVAISSQRYNTIEEANATAEQIVFSLAKNQAEEGMFLVENLLLLPDVNAEEPPQSPIEAPQSPIETPANEESGFMPICADADCNNCDITDPYSFRINIILPAYAPRFLNIDFRRYCERTIRTETPAHIYPKICWVSNEQLQEFEKAYKDWLSVKAGKTADADKKILARFVRILTTLKTVYPPARLQDCSSAEERKLFLLNKNALGTLKT